MNTLQQANPLGIVRTPKQLEDSFRENYWTNAIRYALEYYNAGRFAVLAQLQISANLLHHAVELLIKANLARDDSAADIRQYGYKSSYGHSLGAAWQEFKRRNPDPALDAYDSVVSELDKFETIRYPDKLLQLGATINIELIEDSANIIGSPLAPIYKLSLPPIDRLVKILVDRTHINPAFFQILLQQKHAAPYFTLHNATPLV
jgi:hypothetical protein